MGLLLSFLLLVLLPASGITGYLYTRAADQYASTVGFAVRTEEMSTGLELLGGLSLSGSSSSSDTDILYEFIQSQRLVELIDARLDLRELFSKPAERDPYFAFDTEGSIEDLVAYWGRMVRLVYDSGTGLIEIQVRAFDPQDARNIAVAIFEESSAIINNLSAVARRDATRYAEEDLAREEDRLRAARQALSGFRARTQIVDPAADVQGQMGLLGALQQQLAAAQVELGLLRDTAREGDPRVTQAERRIEVIERQIEAERAKFGQSSGSGEEDYVAIIGEYEALTVDVEFATTAHLAARSSYDAALAEARRQSRYLAAYIEPTLAETPQYPQRLMLASLGALFLGLTWAIGALVYYSIRDRR